MYETIGIYGTVFVGSVVAFLIAYRVMFAVLRSRLTKEVYKAQKDPMFMQVMDAVANQVGGFPGNGNGNGKKRFKGALDPLYSVPVPVHAHEAFEPGVTLRPPLHEGMRGPEGGVLKRFEGLTPDELELVLRDRRERREKVDAAEGVPACGE